MIRSTRIFFHCCNQGKFACQSFSTIKVSFKSIRNITSNWAPCLHTRVLYTSRDFILYIWRFYIKICFNPFGPLTHTQFWSIHFDRFLFYHKNITGIINIIYGSEILHTTAVNLRHYKNDSNWVQFGLTAPKTFSTASIITMTIQGIWPPLSENLAIGKYISATPY